MSSPAAAAAAAKRQLLRMRRPAGAFDARRYFRDAGNLGFYNVGSSAVRALARAIHEAHRDVWSVDAAMAFADRLIADRHLEVKGVAVEVVARYRRAFVPGLLPRWKRWLARGHASNWATTDHVCGSLIGPLLVRHPTLVAVVAGWSSDRNLWVRRASAVGLLPAVRNGLALDQAYDVARSLHHDPADLIQKAVGWLLREAGKRDERRLARYLRANGPRIPRTTVRYAIERFPPAARRQLLQSTRAPHPAPAFPARRRSSRETRDRKGGPMGAEASCAATLNGRRSTGRARLETDVLAFRSAEVVVSIPFRDIRKVVAGDGTLAVTFEGGSLLLHLGRTASRWADKILHPPSLLQKLGVKPHWRASLIGIADERFVAELRGSVAQLSVGRILKPSDVIFFGATRAGQLTRLATLKAAIAPSGAIWVIRPKGRSDISERAVLAAGRAAGLVDVKVVGFSATHTAEKFVIPLRARS